MAALPDYGAGLSGQVLIVQTGPVPPTSNEIEVAQTVARGRMSSGLPVPCLDCVPNIILQDYVCEDGCGEWHFGMLVAHDDTCPTNSGLTAPPR